MIEYTPNPRPEQKLTPHDRQLFQKFEVQMLMGEDEDFLQPVMGEGVKELLRYAYMAGLSEGRRGALQLILEKYEPQPSLRSSTNG
jgi:hypothetical protein